MPDTKKTFLLFLTSILLFSCSSNRIQSKFSPAYLTVSSKFEILPPESMEGKIDGVQRMKASYAGKEFEADVYVIADSEQLSMTILSEFGTSVASLYYDGEALDFDSSVLPKALKPQYIVADFQFCLYNLDSLKLRLKKGGIDFKVFLEELPDGNWAENRILMQNDRKIAKVTKKYEKNQQTDANELKSIKYENFLRGYSYELTGVFE